MSCLKSRPGDPYCVKESCLRCKDTLGDGV